MDEHKRAVYEVQEYIRNVAKVNKNIESLNPDGIYGQKTRDAVMGFQNEFNLLANGKVNFETWQKLLDESNKALFKLSEPIQLALIENDDLPLKTGDVNEAVYTLKLMIKHLSENYTNFTTPIINNKFDEATAEQIKIWQKVISVPQTGEVDKFTWNMLSEFYLLKEELIK